MNKQLELHDRTIEYRKRQYFFVTEKLTFMFAKNFAQNSKFLQFLTKKQPKNNQSKNNNTASDQNRRKP